MKELTTGLLELLRQVDTPTVCNAIEIAQGQRGFSQFTKQTIQIANLNLKPMVGFARTAKIQAATPPKDSPDIVKARRMEYYRYMSLGVRPAVCVIQDLDFPNPIGAFWGEVNNWVHHSFGLCGTLTNGLMRDLDQLVPKYQVIAGGVGPSHYFVHVVEFETPVEVFGMQVKPGDLIHADRHGAIVIPENIIDILETSIKKLMATEKIMIDHAKLGQMDFEAFEKAWEAFQKGYL